MGAALTSKLSIRCPKCATEYRTELEPKFDRLDILCTCGEPLAFIYPEPLNEQVLSPRDEPAIRLGRDLS